MNVVTSTITRRHFEARYNQVGRCMLADLAQIFDVDFSTAEKWADEIDRDTQQQIAAASPTLMRVGQTAGADAPAQRSAPASPGASVADANERDVIHGTN